MPPPISGTDTQLQGLIDLALRGDSSAHEALLHHACDRLLRLTRKMFHGYPSLRRWEATDDVFQNAMLRLHRASSKCESSQSDTFSIWLPSKCVGNCSTWLSITSARMEWGQNITRTISPPMTLADRCTTEPRNLMI